jgi:trehalose-6-phosphate synthase
MPLILRYALTAFIMLAATIFAIAPFTSTLVEQWARRDVELRSILVFNSVRDQLSNLLAVGATTQIDNLFDRLALDERLVAAGFCNSDGSLLYRSKLMPANFSCEKVARTARASFSAIVSDERNLAVSSFPIMADKMSGHLILLHDLTFAEQRGAQERAWITIALAGVAFIGAALASIFALLIVRRWLQSIRRAIDDVKAGRGGNFDHDHGLAFGREIRDVLQELTETRRSIDGTHADWSPDTLRLVMTTQLPDAEIIVVSNREPYIHNRAAEGVALQMPASGLVAAIEPVMRACGGVWVAHGSGSADREVVDGRDCIRVPPSSPSYTLRRVWLSEHEEEGYYFGLANEGLWPLCHIVFVRPTFRETDWNQYRAVNGRFAAAVAAEAKRPDPIVLVQDYHLALLPKMIRERLPQATIITFWHIPWPNAETFGIFPWKEEIIAGLLGSSVLGFHTQFHCNNFIDTVDRFIESRIDREHASVTINGHETFVRAYPISIEWPPAALAGQRPVPACRTSVRASLGLSESIRLGVGIERFDYTKGILDRLRAVDAFLSQHPEWIGRFVFFQVAAPTRTKLPTYRNLQNEAESLASEINARHGAAGYTPILLVVRHYEPEEVFELFRAADLCIVSSLHDGMNLVAKEFVAARDDEQGVLILSDFAGASRELSEALIVNPYNLQSVSAAIGQALSMSGTEQRDRMRLMRDIVCSRNVYRWAGQMLLDAAQLRKRQKIMLMASQKPETALIQDRLGKLAGRARRLVSDRTV